MWLNGFGHSASRDDQWLAPARPLAFDAPDDPVDRVHRAVQNTRPDALVGPARNDLFWWYNVGRRELRRPPEKRVGRNHYPRLDYPAKEGAVRRDAVVSRRCPEVDDDAI